MKKKVTKKRPVGSWKKGQEDYVSIKLDLPIPLLQWVQEISKLSGVGINDTMNVLIAVGMRQRPRV